MAPLSKLAFFSFFLPFLFLVVFSLVLLSFFFLLPHLPQTSSFFNNKIALINFLSPRLGFYKVILIFVFFFDRFNIFVRLGVDAFFLFFFVLIIDVIKNIFTPKASTRLVV